jgi:hypothetical protein
MKATSSAITPCRSYEKSKLFRGGGSVTEVLGVVNASCERAPRVDHRRCHRAELRSADSIIDVGDGVSGSAWAWAVRSEVDAMAARIPIDRASAGGGLRGRGFQPGGRLESRRWKTSTPAPAMR